MPKILKPGQIVPESGQARLIGGKTEITLIEGKRVPPIGKGKGQRIQLVDRTKHKS